MKWGWLGKVLDYAPEVVQLGMDVKDALKDDKTRAECGGRVLLYLVRQVARVESTAANERMQLEMRINSLERRLQQ